MSAPEPFKITLKNGEEVKVNGTALPHARVPGADFCRPCVLLAELGRA